MTLYPLKLSNYCNSTILTFFFPKMPTSHILFKIKNKKQKEEEEEEEEEIC